MESSGYQGIFYFFSGSRTIFGAGSETIFVLYFSLLSSHSVADSGCLFDNLMSEGEVQPLQGRSSLSRFLR